ncbi:hypothetical protein BH09PAT1_BH09PAT1_1640 [soil metagenome]
MAYKTVLAVEIWEALVEDPIFQKGGPEEMQLLMRPFVEALPVTLGEELLASLVSVPTLMKAKMLFLRYCIDNGFVKQAAEASGFPEFMLQGLLESLLGQLEQFVENSAQLLEESGMTEAEVFEQEKLGIRQEVLDQIRAGMTIEQLLVTQPSIIVVNPS